MSLMPQEILLSGHVVAEKHRTGQIKQYLRKISIRLFHLTLN